MSSIQGPAIFLAQFMRDEAPFNSLDSISKWMSDLGYKGVQIPAWDARCIDLDKAAESKSYAEDIRAKLDEYGLQPTELAAHLQGQVLGIHPAYAELFQPFYPEGLNDSQRVEWAQAELIKAVKASANLGTNNIPAMTGGLAWPFLYPWPQRPAGLIEESFAEMGRRWLPVLDAAHENGIAFTYELHPGSDVYDGITFEMFLENVDQHPAACINYDPSHFVLQQLDYLEFIQIYSKRIKAFHVKDAEFNPTGKQGVYSGYQPWAKRAGRFRSLGDGQVDFTRVFTLMTEAGYRGWAVIEWECCVKDSEQGAREGVDFVNSHLINATETAFDDFVGSDTDDERNRRVLGIGGS